jgi:hypothetical protein
MPESNNPYLAYQKINSCWFNASGVLQITSRRSRLGEDTTAGTRSVCQGISFFRCKNGAAFPQFC